MPESPVESITTSIIVVHPSSPQLLCVRHPSFGAWMFPGGRLEANEAPDEAALREIAEEVGLSVSLIDLSDLPRWSDHENSRLPQPLAIIREKLPEGEASYVDIVYVGIARGSDLQMRREVVEAGWFDRDALMNLSTPFPIKELAAEAFDRLADLRRLAISEEQGGTPGSDAAAL
jgi:8-oxo-dGTP pyrophosphatase MutT (NUDIX family)